MRNQTDVQHVQLLHRAPVDSELDIVIALGLPKGWQPGTGDGGWWSEKTKVGLFLQRRGEPGLLYKLAAENGFHDADCYARVERATATDVVISCTPEKGRAGPNRKYVYDIRAKAVVKRVDYDPFAMHRAFVSGKKAVLVGSNLHRVVALEYDPEREPAFRLLTGAEAENWTRRVPFTQGTYGIGAEQRKVIYPEPKQFKPLHFGPGNRFTVSQDGISERIGGAAKRFPLPEKTEIGPRQIVDDTLWYAKTFYDGEGMTGVGGFGSFDTQTREYRTYSPEDIKRWSATAMLVEPEAIWLGLAHRGEYGDSGGGVLRFNRATQKVTRLVLQETVSAIARAGDRLVVATAFGAALFDGGKLRRFFVDETTAGRLRVAEALK
jgi:hypothetical protein